MSKLHLLIFIHNFVIVVLLISKCLGLASEAFYTIQNEGTKFCLSVGPVIRFEPEETSLFKDGLVATRDCTDSDPNKNLTAVDFGQQWLVHIKTQDPRKFNFNVILRKRNTLYVDQQLTAVLRGEFISYFPNILNLKGEHPMNSTSQSQQFIISDTHNHKCLVDSEINQARFAKCDDSNGKYQWWNFTLINDIDAVKAELKRKINKYYDSVGFFP